MWFSMDLKPKWMDSSLKYITIFDVLWTSNEYDNLGYDHFCKHARAVDVVCNCFDSLCMILMICLISFSFLCCFFFLSVTVVLICCVHEAHVYWLSYDLFCRVRACWTDIYLLVDVMLLCLLYLDCCAFLVCSLTRGERGCVITNVHPCFHVFWAQSSVTH